MTPRIFVKLASSSPESSSLSSDPAHLPSPPFSHITVLKKTCAPSRGKDVLPSASQPKQSKTTWSSPDGGRRMRGDPAQEGSGHRRKLLPFECDLSKNDAPGEGSIAGR